MTTHKGIPQSGFGICQHAKPIASTTVFFHVTNGRIFYLNASIFSFSFQLEYQGGKFLQFIRSNRKIGEEIVLAICHLIPGIGQGFPPAAIQIGTGRRTIHNCGISPIQAQAGSGCFVGITTSAHQRRTAFELNVNNAYLVKFRSHSTNVLGKDHGFIVQSSIGTSQYHNTRFLLDIFSDIVTKRKCRSIEIAQLTPLTNGTARVFVHSKDTIRNLIFKESRNVRLTTKPKGKGILVGIFSPNRYRIFNFDALPSTSFLVGHLNGALTCR
mmetsp:Transcript_28323/g.42829  ORF Transcript_28323/g.42829 Transcript_28323/m.42829 type:complete len:270 (-) Transcript_28323:454-1263(-)